MVGGDTAEGRLVFARDALVAVLVRLSGRHYGAMEDRWFLEAGFGPCAEASPDPFDTIEQASDWINGAFRPLAR